MSRDSDGGDVLLAFLIGAAAGAAVALLFAPVPGERTREFLTQKARERRDEAADLARQGREAWERQRDALATAFERGREAFEQAKESKEQA
jgi:gas vesicle protein